MNDRDEIIRSQLDVIASLINKNLRDLSDELWGFQENGKEEVKKDDKVIKFPGKCHSS